MQRQSAAWPLTHRVFFALLLPFHVPCKRQRENSHRLHVPKSDEESELTKQDNWQTQIYKSNNFVLTLVEWESLAILSVRTMRARIKTTVFQCACLQKPGKHLMLNCSLCWKATMATRGPFHRARTLSTGGAVSRRTRSKYGEMGAILICGKTFN